MSSIDGFKPNKMVENANQVHNLKFSKKSKSKKPAIEILSTGLASSSNVDALVESRIKPVSNSQITSEFLKSLGISAYEKNIIALKNIMQSPAKIYSKKVANAIDGFNYNLNENPQRAIYFFRAFLLVANQEFDKNKSMRRLVFGLYLCNNHLKPLFPIINRMIQEDAFADYGSIRSGLESILIYVKSLSNKGLSYYKADKFIRPMTVKKTLKAFDKSFPLFIETLRKFKSQNDAIVEEASKRFENLLIKFGPIKTLNIYQYLIKGSDPKYQLQPIILGMLKACEAEKYFFNFSFFTNPRNNSDIDLSQNFRLTGDGIELILRFLKEKNIECMNLPAKICNTYVDLFNEVKEMIKDDIERQFFFVKSKTFHISSVYLEKDQEGGYSLVIIDATNYQTEASSFIRKAIPEEIPLRIYCSSILMQFDNVNCTVFSLRHFTQFAKHSKEILEHIKNLNNKELQEIEQEIPSSNTFVFEFTNLPSILMKLSQSLNDIINYENETKTSVELSIKHIRKEWIKKDGLPVNKLINTKISGFSWKYHLLILQSCIENASTS